MNKLFTESEQNCSAASIYIYEKTVPNPVYFFNYSQQMLDARDGQFNSEPIRDIHFLALALAFASFSSLICCLQSSTVRYRVFFDGELGLRTISWLKADDAYKMASPGFSRKWAVPAMKMSISISSGPFCRIQKFFLESPNQQQNFSTCLVLDPSYYLVAHPFIFSCAVKHRNGPAMIYWEDI